MASRKPAGPFPALGSEARAEIDLDAFRHNVRTLSDLVKPAATMLAVKANAYGHGMLPLARAALKSGASSLAVLDVPAALALREAGIDARFARAIKQSARISPEFASLLANSN